MAHFLGLHHHASHVPGFYCVPCALACSTGFDVFPSLSVARAAYFGPLVGDIYFLPIVKFLQSNEILQQNWLQLDFDIGLSKTTLAAEGSSSSAEHVEEVPEVCSVLLSVPKGPLSSILSLVEPPSASIYSVHPVSVIHLPFA